MAVRVHQTSRQNLIANLSVDQLYAFQMVVRSGSFRGAAEQLTLSQAAVSQRMRHLEAVLGAPLFERRRGAKARLTPIGHELLALAEDTLRRVDEFHRRLERAKQPSDRSTLTIASSSDHIKYLLIRAVAALRVRQRGIRVVILHVPSVRETMEKLSARSVDLGICRSPAPRGLTPLGVIHERLHLYAHPGHPILGVPVAERLQALSRTDLATFATGMRSRDMLDRWAGKAGVTLRVVIESRNLEAMRAAAVEGLAAAILPEYSAKDDVAAGRLTAVRMPGLPLDRDAVIVAHPEASDSYEIRSFLEVLDGDLHAAPWEDLSDDPAAPAGTAR